MKNIFHNRRFWLTVAHGAVIGAGVAGSVLFPPATLAIMTGATAVSALIPSPVSPAIPMPKPQVPPAAPK